MTDVASKLGTRGAAGGFLVALLLAATMTLPSDSVASATPASRASVGESGATATDTSWRPKTGAVPDVPNVLYVESAPGEWVGGGRTFTFTPANSQYDVAVRNGMLAADVAGDDRWQAGFSLPPNTTSYVAGRTYVDIAGPSWEHVGIGITRSPHGCNTFVQRGWYAIDEATTVDGVLQSATIRFEQRCDGPSSPPLRGLLRYDADAPPPPPETPSLPVPALWMPSGGSVPTSDNSLYLLSEPGDSAGQGGTSLFTGSEVEISSTGNELRATAIASAGVDAGSGQLWLRGSGRATTLDAGLYSRLLDHSDANDGRGTFLAQRNIRDCITRSSTSWVVVDESDQRGGAWNDVTLRFEQRCDSGQPAMRGRLHWETPPPAGAPSEPTAVAATTSAASATVTWAPSSSSGSGPITGYEVFTYVDGTVRQAPVAVGPTVRSVTLSGLAPGVTHSFKVRAVNASGASRRSVRTRQPSPPTAVPAVHALSPSTGPRTRGTPVIVTGANLVGATAVTVGGHAVEWWPVSDTAIEFIAPALAPGPHEVVISSPLGTSSPTAGSVWVAAKLPPHPPGLVLGTPRAGGIDVTWMKPGSDAPLLGYTLTATKVGASAPQRTVPAGPTATSAAIDRLTPGASYTVAVEARSSAGTSRTAADQALTVPLPELGPYATATALVGQQYRDFAGRPPTAAEAAAGANRITSGADLPEAAVAAMRNRHEWGGLRAPIVRLYTAYFSRIPDAAGLAYWAGKRRLGTSLAQVSATFAASSEFHRKQGRLNDPAFVRFIYDAVLGRSPDPAGLAYWTRKLAAGTSRGTVMTGFSEAPEHVRKTLATVDVVLVFTGMLRRSPTSDELAAERTAIEGGAPVAQLVRRLLDSEPYAARIAG